MKDHIFTETTRVRDGEHFNPIANWRPWPKAFELFVIYELGFGGRVTSVEPHRVATETHVLSCKDTTLFIGDLADMDLFNKVAVIHQYLTATELKSFSEATFDSMKRQGIPTSAFNMAHIGMMIQGTNLAKVALLLALELLDFAHVDLKDLCVIAHLLHTGQPRDEVLQLVQQEELHGS